MEQVDYSWYDSDTKAAFYPRSPIGSGSKQQIRQENTPCKEMLLKLVFAAIMNHWQNATCTSTTGKTKNH